MNSELQYKYPLNTHMTEDFMLYYTYTHIYIKALGNMHMSVRQQKMNYVI